MHAPADSVPAAQPVLMRLLVRSWEYRRPRLWVGVRVACGIFNVALGVLLLASVHWLGSLTWLAVLPGGGLQIVACGWDLARPGAVKKSRSSVGRLVRCCASKAAPRQAGSRGLPEARRTTKRPQAG